MRPPGRAELWAAGSREGFARRPGLGGRKGGKEGGTGLREAPCPGGDVPLPSPAHLTRCKVAFAIKTQVPQGLLSTLLCAEPAQARRRQEAARGRGRGRGGRGRPGRLGPRHSGGEERGLRAPGPGAHRLQSGVFWPRLGRAHWRIGSLPPWYLAENPLLKMRSLWLNRYLL